MSARELQFRLASIGIDASDLNAILISHEHNDHIRGAATLSRRFNIPLYANRSTFNGAKIFNKCNFVEFEAGTPFYFRDLYIDPFQITHDASDPVGFRIESDKSSIGIATDLGVVTRLVQDKLSCCRVLVVEFNHDDDLLANGPYPWHLKQRIKSRHGHLSNSESAALLDELAHSNLTAVFLAHISEVNNAPELVMRKTIDFLQRQNICSPHFILGDQNLVSQFLSV